MSTKKNWKKKRCQGSIILETCSGYAQYPENFFNQMLFIKRLFCFGTRFGYVKKHKLFSAAFSTIRWVKPDGPAKPILLTSTLLIRSPAGIGRRSRLVININAEGCLPKHKVGLPLKSSFV